MSKVRKKVKQGLVPRLRFPEFRDEGEWEMKTLDSLLSYQQPKDYLVSDTKYSDAYKTPVLTAGKTFILGYTNEQHGIFCDNLPVIIFDDFTTATQFVDFLFKAKSSAIKILQAKSGVNIKFMYEVMQMISYEVGSHERHWISKFALMSIPVPKLAEQQKIADCLSSLDALITAQAEKLQALKTHKKGLMQQLFPRSGETVPRLRFPEFRDAGEWEVKKLGDICDVRDGTHDSPQFYNTGKPLVTSKNLLSSGLLDLENVSYISQADYEKINKRSKVDISDILFGMIGTIGNAVMVNLQGFAIKNVALIKQKTDLLNCYLVQFLNSEYIATRFKALNTGNIQKFIALGQIRNLSFPVPSVKEQQKIADCLASLDALITAQAEKLQALKKHKKGLMQQLFPTLDEVQE